MTVPDLAQLLAQYGPAIFLALGFLEYIGAPIAAVPALIAGGALVGMVGVSTR